LNFEVSLPHAAADSVQTHIVYFKLEIMEDQEERVPLMPKKALLRRSNSVVSMKLRTTKSFLLRLREFLLLKLELTATGEFFDILEMLLAFPYVALYIYLTYQKTHELWLWCIDQTLAILFFLDFFVVSS